MTFKEKHFGHVGYRFDTRLRRHERTSVVAVRAIGGPRRQLPPDRTHRNLWRFTCFAASFGRRSVGPATTLQVVLIHVGRHLAPQPDAGYLVEAKMHAAVDSRVVDVVADLL
jgi:hypothetical protein